LNGSDRLKIAVFIDFDNIEIGVKSTLNRHFDVGTVLEAIKERGEVVTKVAYGDWKRAGEHSRSMTQHAIQMVQRNLTPGGDKNGADINLALDAIEMAFTRNHINAFVIVGGDSDFIALVEKLKQYDKKVMVVGGRSFTSSILQKNCHEFIAYENLINAPQTTPRRPAERTRSAGPGDANLAKALPLVRRALKVLSDREVSPQLGLLKSTLLQLDSTFSERDYSASTFRDFIEKMAAAGYVLLKQVDRSLLVELKESGSIEEQETIVPPAAEAAPLVQQPVDVQPAQVSNGGYASSVPSGPSPEQAEEGVRALFDAFRNAKNPPHWPMYLRNVRQYVKNAAPTYDERRFGFANFLEAVRAAGRAGLFRLERNRQGILRIFAGGQFPRPVPVPADVVNGEMPVEAEVVEAAPVLEAEVIPYVEEEPAPPAVAEEEDLDDSIGNRIIDEPKPQPVRRRTARAGTPAKKRPAPVRKSRKKSPSHHET
jgi:uncharacterized LabA/DUF88 family protein